MAQASDYWWPEHLLPPTRPGAQLTFTPVEDGQRPISQGHQHASLHLSAKGRVRGQACHPCRPISPTLLSLTYTRLSTESFSLMECRHFFQCATAECTYSLREKPCGQLFPATPPQPTG